MRSTMISATGLALLFSSQFAAAGSTDFTQGMNRCMAQPRADTATCAVKVARQMRAATVDIKRHIGLGETGADPTADEICIGSSDLCTLYECNGSGFTSDVCSEIGFCFEEYDSSTCVYDSEE